MKFSQIGLLLAVFFFVFSCRETLGEQHRNSQKEHSVPSSDKKELPKKRIEDDTPTEEKSTTPKPAVRKKAKKRDTLKPRRAIP